MQSRRKITIGIVAVFLGILFVVSSVLLWLGFQEFRKEGGRLDASAAELKSLYSHNPFPSVHNVRSERGNLADMEEQLAGLFQALRVGQIESVEQSPPKFSSQFWATHKLLREKALKAGVIIGGQKDFGFGFERHMKGELPLPQDVPRLTQQLRIVEMLCDVLFDARINELKGLGREEFEGEASASGPAQPEPTAGRSRRGSKAVAVTTSLNCVNRNAGIIPPGALYGTWHFVLKFTAKEKALLDVLNRFARSPAFVVVTDVSLSSPEQGVGRAPEKTAEAPPPRRGGALQEAPVTEETPGAIVCGHDLPLTVTMELDVYQFAGPSPAKGESETKGAP